MLLACSDNNTAKQQHHVDLAAFINYVYCEIVHTLTSGANAYIATCRKNFF